MSPGQTGHITGQMGRVPGTDGTHTRGCPAKILYVYWFSLSPIISARRVGAPNRASAICDSNLVKLASILDSCALKPSCDLLRFLAMCPRELHFSAGKCAFLCRNT